MGTLGNAIPTLSDYLQIVSGGFVAPQPSKWVRLVNNATGVAYVSSSATDATGLWTVANVPTGSYTLSYSVNVGGPWTASGDANYEVSGLDGSPTATANYGLVNIGAGPWDGSTSGFFAGHASGTVVAANASSGFAGNLLDYQVAGVSKFRVASLGAGVSAERSSVVASGQTLTVTGGFANQRFNLFAQPTVSGAFTLTNPATVAIANAPAAAGGATLTNPAALWVQAGTSRFDGPLTMGSGATLTTDSGAATGSGFAVTLNKQVGTITTESLSTAAGGVTVYTVTNSLVTYSSRIFLTVFRLTNTVGPLYATNPITAPGSFTVSIYNGHASQPLNGTVGFYFLVLP